MQWNFYSYWMLHLQATRPRLPCFGFNGGIDLSCAKKLIIGAPSGGDCATGFQYDAGLCYPNCKAGYTGVGPVCWGDAPTGWVGCGMGAAKDAKTCKEAIVSQLQTVGQLAMNIYTLGASTSLTAAKNAAIGATKISTLTKKLAELKAAAKANLSVSKIVEKAKKFKDSKKKGEKLKEA